MNKTRRHLLKTSLLGGAAVAAGCTPDVSGSAQNTTETFEPLRILVLGGTVGFVIFSIIVPILQMNEVVQ